MQPKDLHDSLVENGLSSLGRGNAFSDDRSLRSHGTYAPQVEVCWVRNASGPCLTNGFSLPSFVAIIAGLRSCGNRGVVYTFANGRSRFFVNDVVTLLVGGALGFVASILANAVTGPVLSLASRHAIVKTLAMFPFVSDRRFAGRWRVVWSVDSPGYASTNPGETEVSSCLGAVAFSASSRGYGTERTYLYVGRLAAGVLSGRWYDRDGREAYHGLFQLRLAGTEHAASGKWIGWANDGSVKEGNLRLERI